MLCEWIAFFGEGRGVCCGDLKGMLTCGFVVVRIGGGDQIYNDGIRVHGPLREWTSIGNPKKRREYPFPETLRLECDEYYLNNYIKW